LAAAAGATGVAAAAAEAGGRPRPRFGVSAAAAGAATALAAGEALAAGAGLALDFGLAAAAGFGVAAGLAAAAGFFPAADFGVAASAGFFESLLLAVGVAGVDGLLRPAAAADAFLDCSLKRSKRFENSSLQLGHSKKEHKQIVFNYIKTCVEKNLYYCLIKNRVLFSASTQRTRKLNLFHCKTNETQPVSKLVS
jgi:hypothetical protein